MRITRWIAPLALALAVAGPAAAQDQPAGGDSGGHHGRFRAACGQDLQTYCASAQSRDDRRQCMMANKDKLSDTCKQFLDSMSSMHGGAMQGAPSGQ